VDQNQVKDAAAGAGTPNKKTAAVGSSEQKEEEKPEKPTGHKQEQKS
jgi:hypothetical protein